MTTVADVEKLLARARRLSGQIREVRGEGASWEYTFPDGITERYTITDIKPVEHLEDDVSNLFLWAWSGILDGRANRAGEARIIGMTRGILPSIYHQA